MATTAGILLPIGPVVVPSWSILVSVAWRMAHNTYIVQHIRWIESMPSTFITLFSRPQQSLSSSFQLFTFPIQMFSCLFRRFVILDVTTFSLTLNSHTKCIDPFSGILRHILIILNKSWHIWMHYDTITKTSENLMTLFL